MSTKTIPLVFFLFSLVLLGCKKDSSDLRCQELKQAMNENNVTSVKSLITDIIKTLPSDIYSEQSVKALAASLSNECGVSAEVLCFSCIQTLPEQTEIRLSFSFSGNIFNKIIDISYTQPTNKMKIVNMHD
jgi:hypothetical protein